MATVKKTPAERGARLLDDQVAHKEVVSGETMERSRVGAPTTRLMHDKGLSTTIEWQDKDAPGKPVPSDQRAQPHRFRTLDERFHTKNGQERDLKQP